MSNEAEQSVQLAFEHAATTVQMYDGSVAMIRMIYLGLVAQRRRIYTSFEQLIRDHNEPQLQVEASSDRLRNRLIGALNMQMLCIDKCLDDFANILAAFQSEEGGQRGPWLHAPAEDGDDTEIEADAEADEEPLNGEEDLPEAAGADGDAGASSREGTSAAASHQQNHSAAGSAGLHHHQRE